MDLKTFIIYYWLDEAWFVELKWSFRRIFWKNAKHLL